MSNPVVEALKEMGRVIVLAIIPVAIPMIERWEIDWKLIATVAIITLLRGVDKILHELGKEEKDESLIKGLVRF
jgi:hypothetical protein